MVKFSTSLICCDLSNIKEDLDTLLELPEQFHNLHADFMDGHFVPRYGISPELIQWIRKRYGKNFTIDSHLMVSDPIQFIDVIAPYSDEFAFHYESLTDPLRLLQILQRDYKGVKPYIATNLFTDPTDVAGCMNALTGDANILLMGISPGVLGTKSFPKVVQNKLKTLNGTANVIIDGAVNFNTIPTYKDSLTLGTLKLVCGNSSIFKNDERDLDRKALIVNNATKMMEIINE